MAKAGIEAGTNSNWLALRLLLRLLRRRPDPRQDTEHHMKPAVHDLPAVRLPAARDPLHGMVEETVQIGEGQLGVGRQFDPDALLVPLRSFSKTENAMRQATQLTPAALET